jgi:hypothetical protein
MIKVQKKAQRLEIYWVRYATTNTFLGFTHLILNAIIIYFAINLIIAHQDDDSPSYIHAWITVTFGVLMLGLVFLSLVVCKGFVFLTYFLCPMLLFKFRKMISRVFREEKPLDYTL